MNSTTRIFGSILSGIGMAIGIIGTLWTIYLCFKIAFIVGGPLGVLVGAMTGPVLFFAAPIYAWFQWGDISVPVVQYGSLLIGSVLIGIGAIFSNQKTNHKQKEINKTYSFKKKSDIKVHNTLSKKLFSLKKGVIEKLKIIRRFNIKRIIKAEYNLSVVIIVVIIISILTNVAWDKRGKINYFFREAKQVIIWLADFKKPVISEVNVSDISEYNAKITWKTNELTKTKFYLGTDTNYTLWQESFSRLSYDHWLNKVPDLEPGTTYHFKIVATDRRGNKTEHDYTFDTLEDKNVLTTTSSEDINDKNQNLIKPVKGTGDVINKLSPEEKINDIESAYVDKVTSEIETGLVNQVVDDVFDNYIDKKIDLWEEQVLNDQLNKWLPSDNDGNIKRSQEGGNKTLFTITKVIDGDTIVIEGGEHVRLLGIDADEPGYPCYYDAKNRLEELVLIKKVILESDQTDRDQYDRLLRYIIIGDININLELVKEGRAICRSYNPDTKYKDECSVLEQDAKNNKLGCKWEETIATEPVCTVLTTEETGYDVVKAEDADNYIGTSKIVEGHVASTRKYSNPAIYINFCKPYPNHCFLSIVWNSDWSKFPSDAASLYYGQTVRIKGYIKPHNGKPEIIMDDPSDIEICK